MGANAVNGVNGATPVATLASKFESDPDRVWATASRVEQAVLSELSRGLHLKTLNKRPGFFDSPMLRNIAAVHPSPQSTVNALTSVDKDIAENAPMDCRSSDKARVLTLAPPSSIPEDESQSHGGVAFTHGMDSETHPFLSIDPAPPPFEKRLNVTDITPSPSETPPVGPERRVNEVRQNALRRFFGYFFGTGVGKNVENVDVTGGGETVENVDVTANKWHEAQAREAAAKENVQAWATRFASLDVASSLTSRDVDSGLAVWETAIVLGVESEAATKKILVSPALLKCLGEGLSDTQLPLENRFALIERYIKAVGKAYGQGLLSRDATFAVLVGTGGKIYWNSAGEIRSQKSSRRNPEEGSVTAKLFLDALAPTVHSKGDSARLAKVAQVYANVLAHMFRAEPEAWMDQKLAGLKSHTGYGPSGALNLFDALSPNGGGATLRGSDAVDAAFTCHGYKPNMVRVHVLGQDALTEFETHISNTVALRQPPQPRAGLLERIRAAFSRFAAFSKGLFGLGS